MANQALEELAPHFTQVGYVVRDLAAGEAWFRGTLGVPAWTRMENMTFALGCSLRGRAADYSAHLSLGYLGGIQVELIEPIRGESLYSEFLERRGPGLHHLAFDVPDFDATVAALTDTGLPLLAAGRVAPGSRFAYFDCEAAQASVIEILGFDDATRALMRELRRQSVAARER